MGSLYKTLILKKGKEVSLKRMHCWVFSGALEEEQQWPENGAIVEVIDHNGRYVATGHYQHSSIAVRILTFSQQALDTGFWIKRIKRAHDLRKHTGIACSSMTSGYRLVFAEGDDLPGLIIDWYDGAAVIQTHTDGMIKARGLIAEALRMVFGDQLHTVYHTSAVKGNQREEEFLFGKKPGSWFLENGLSFYAKWEEGQKTGYFLDQRENRYLVRRYAEGRNVLDAFCHAGGFSVNALKGGASGVTLVDVSKTALKVAESNLEKNGYQNYQIKTSDVLEFLQETSNTYDLMIIDPPAYAKHLSARHKAVQGYKRLNQEAIKKIGPGGILFTFSCSQVVDSVLFENTVRAAAIQTKRQIRILYRLSQPPDHPVNIYHPESEYLKGLVLYVE